MTTEPEPASVVPCPWCAAMNVEVAEGSTFRWRKAMCAVCGAEAPEVRVQTTGSGTRDEWQAAADREAVQTWNQCAIRLASIAASGILLRFEAECLSKIHAYQRKEAFANDAIERKHWQSLKDGISEAAALLQRLTACPDAVLQVDNEAMRDSIKQLADEWCVHASNGMDVLASACLDEIDAKVQSVRP